LKPLDRLGDGGLGDVEFGRRIRKTPAADNEVKDF
jgi:hypothetical protein